MAIVEGVRQADGVHFFEGIGASDTTRPIALNGPAGLGGAVQAVVGGGTGFNSGTLTVQVSNDGTNWATLNDVDSTALTFTAAGLKEFSTGAAYLRLSADGSINDVDVYIAVRR